MDIERLRKEAKRKYTLEISTLDFVETNRFADDVQFISDACIYMHETTYAENVKTLVMLRRLMKLELMSYHINGGLAIRYGHEDTPCDIIFFCTDVEHALEKVSNGKCSLVTETHTETRVACDI